LHLAENQLTSVPESLGGLTRLEVLDLSDNMLEAVPAELGGLSALHTLHLNANQLTSLPADLGKARYQPRHLVLFTMYTNEIMVGHTK